MSSKLLMFPEFVRSAKALFSENPIEATEYKTNITAVEDSRYIFTPEPPESGYNLSLTRLNAMKKSGREIGMLEIRCNYLLQLSAMLQQDGADEKEVQLGIISANITPVKITASQLQRSAEAEMLILLSHENSIKSFFSDGLLAEHGLLNTVSIKLQNPMATMLFSLQQISRMGLTIRSNSRAILLFTPVTKSFIERDGVQLPAYNATHEEQLDIISGKLPLKQNIHYAIDQYYDIGDLRMTERQREILLMTSRTENVGYEHVCRFASTLQNEAGIPLKVQSATMQGVSVASLYDAWENTILINSRLHPSHKMGELIERLSDAIITTTSPSTIPLQAFEKQLLSVQLSTAWSVAPSKTTFAGLCAAFDMAQKEGGAFSLEAVTARVNRAAHYITHGVGVAIEQEMSMTQQQGRDRTARAAQPSIEEGPLANFLEGL